MLDLMMLALVVVSFALAMAYAYLCDRQFGLSAGKDVLR